MRRFLVAREKLNKYYPQEEVGVELGLEGGDIGNFYFSMHRGGGGTKKKATAFLALLREGGVFRAM